MKFAKELALAASLLVGSHEVASAADKPQAQPEDSIVQAEIMKRVEIFNLLLGKTKKCVAKSPLGEVSAEFDENTGEFVVRRLFDKNSEEPVPYELVLRDGSNHVPIDGDPDVSEVFRGDPGQSQLIERINLHDSSVSPEIKEVAVSYFRKLMLQNLHVCAVISKGQEPPSCEPLSVPSDEIIKRDLRFRIPVFAPQCGATTGR